VFETIAVLPLAALALTLALPRQTPRETTAGREELASRSQAGSPARAA
jgi:hypothetical protein